MVVRRIAAVVVVAVLSLAIAGCSDDDQKAASPQPDSNEPTAIEDSAVPTENVPAANDVPESVAPESEKLPAIEIIRPADGDTFNGSFQLSGSAQVSEGDMRWTLRLRGSDAVAKSGRFRANCGAPCRGPFKTVVGADQVVTGPYELRVFAPNAAGGAPLHEQTMTIVISNDK